MITTSNDRGGLRRASIRLGTARGATFHSPACCSLAIRKAPRLAGVGLEVVDLADDELVGGQFLAGGVVDDVLADPGGQDDGGVGGDAFGLVPVAGEVLGGIDDDGAAAVLDAPERTGARGQEVLGPPDGVVVGQGAGACTPPRGRSPS